MIVDIYTDGSHLDKKNNGRLGCGGVLVISGKAVNSFSEELTPEFTLRKYGTDKCSNPSAELIAVSRALDTFKPVLKRATKIIIHADYLGVREWMTGAWKIKETYIKRIKEEIDKQVVSLGLDGKIEYKWVKGHQSATSTDPDAKWNNYVDKLAKGLSDD